MKRNKDSPKKQENKVEKKFVVFFVVLFICGIIIGSIIGNRMYQPVDENKEQDFKIIAEFVYENVNDIFAKQENNSSGWSTKTDTPLALVNSIQGKYNEDLKVLIRNKLVIVSDTELEVKVEFLKGNNHIEVREKQSKMGLMVDGAIAGGFIAMIIFVIMIIFMSRKKIQKVIQMFAS